MNTTPSRSRHSESRMFQFLYLPTPTISNLVDYVERIFVLVTFCKIQMLTQREKRPVHRLSFIIYGLPAWRERSGAPRSRKTGALPLFRGPWEVSRLNSFYLGTPPSRRRPIKLSQFLRAMPSKNEQLTSVTTSTRLVFDNDGVACWVLEIESGGWVGASDAKRVAQAGWSFGEKEHEVKWVKSIESRDKAEKRKGKRRAALYLFSYLPLFCSFAEPE